jgi:hypothetical protein
MPEYHLLPDWLLDPITGLLAELGFILHYNNDGTKITAAAASDLATLKTLAKACSDAQVAHGLDTGIHSAADGAFDEPAAFSSSPSEPADLAECVAILNELKVDFNAHNANATPHRGVGGRATVNVLQNVLTSLENAGLLPHYEQAPSSDLVTAATSTDLATSKTLAKAIADAHVLHGLDAEVHSAADAALNLPAAFTSSPSEPADLAEVGAIANELKDDINLHVANATPHRGVGGQAAITVLQVTTADYTSTQAEADTLLNALKAAYNLHVKMGAPAAPAQEDLITVNCSDQATAEALANAYKVVFNRHCDLGFADFLVD